MVATSAGGLTGAAPVPGSAASPAVGPAAPVRAAPSLLAPAPLPTPTWSQRASATRNPAVRLTARLGAGARLGRSAPLSIGLHVDRRRVVSTLTDVRILTPTDLDLTRSSLGAAACRRPESDFERVRIENVVPVGCPGNALLGSGTAAADLRFSAGQAIPGSGQLRLFTGAAVDGRPGLVVLVATVHPIVTQLVYGGYLYTAPQPYRLAMRIRIPAMADPPFGSPVALVGLQMTIGGDDIVYTRRERGHRIRFAPGGIPLPERCPRGGFPFRALLRFDDGSRRTADAIAPCPKPRRAATT